MRAWRTNCRAVIHSNVYFYCALLDQTRRKFYFSFGVTVQNDDQIKLLKRKQVILLETNKLSSIILFAVFSISEGYLGGEHSYQCGFKGQLTACRWIFCSPSTSRESHRPCVTRILLPYLKVSTYKTQLITSLY